MRSGYRIVLSYNLLLRGDRGAAARPGAAPALVDAVSQGLAEHFSTPAPGRRGRLDPDAGDPPNRLVYLLDHEYTEASLGWSRLKGDDASRAAVLEAAAAASECDVVLALADIHETWNCFEPEWRRPWGARSRAQRWDDDDDPDDDFDDDAWDGAGSEYELGELADRGITLDCWVSPSDQRAEPVATTVADVEVCATTPSADLRPYDSAYEGYMGNYGNTMDRWYRRAAEVLWPRWRAFAVRAEASPGWALDELSKRVRAGGAAGAQEAAAALAPFWATSVGPDPQRGFTAKALWLACALDEPALATMLLKPLRVEALAPGHARAVVALVERYGERWARDLLAEWSGRGRAWAPTPGRG
ncbi:MAG: 2OG-Fe(II) oxygenase, partial [Acidimicrobiales bacterium]